MIRSHFAKRLVNTKPRGDQAPLITIFHVFANPTKSSFALPAVGWFWGAGTLLRHEFLGRTTPALRFTACRGARCEYMLQRKLARCSLAAFARIAWPPSGPFFCHGDVHQALALLIIFSVAEPSFILLDIPQ